MWRQGVRVHGLPHVAHRGLEAALALHIVGNISVFALAAVGLVDVNAAEVGWPGLVISLLVTLTPTFTAVVLRLAQRHVVQRTFLPSCGGVPLSGGSFDGQLVASREPSRTTFPGWLAYTLIGS